MQVYFSVVAKMIFKDLDVTIFFVSTDMAFGDVDVQLVLEHVERHPLPSQKPQVGLDFKLACVQGAGLPCFWRLFWTSQISWKRVSVTLAYVPTQCVLA